MYCLCSNQSASFLLASEAVDFILTKKVESKKKNLRLNVRKVREVNSGLKSMSLQWCRIAAFWFVIHPEMVAHLGRREWGCSGWAALRLAVLTPLPVLQCGGLCE